jgi:hypothetical protein
MIGAVTKKVVRLIDSIISLAKPNLNTFVKYAKVDKTVFEAAKLIFFRYQLKNNLQFINYSSCSYYNDNIL